MLKNVLDLFYEVGYTLHVGGPHARGMPRAQDDGRKRRVCVRIYTFTSPYLRLSRGTLAREKRKLRVRIYTFTPILAVVTR